MRSNPLETRKQIILKAIVTDYVRTAEPIGSKLLVSRYEFGVRSATIRSEMAELSELGYLQQPHTSAGRIPSDLGYRFYVDRLMETAALSVSEAASVREKLAPRRTEIEMILEQTCKLLSDMARYTSVATTPMLKDSRISHISIVNVGHSKVLCVMVLDNGRVVHELLEFDEQFRNADPIVATNFLTRKLSGCTLEALATSDPTVMLEDAADMKDLLARVLELVKRELELSDESGIHLEGASYIMQQPEFKDVERLESVLSVLEQRSALYKLFSSVYLGPEVTVVIGTEIPIDEMRDCSFVGARYHIGGRPAGTIGVVGPTRMDYRRAVSAVEFMARNLGELLTGLSVD